MTAAVIVLAAALVAFGVLHVLANHAWDAERRFLINVAADERQILISQAAAERKDLIEQLEAERQGITAERERLVRALLARNLPEFASLERIVANQMNGGDKPGPAEIRERLKTRYGAGPDRDPDVPPVPEGL